MGSVTCSLDVRLQGEAKLRLSKQCVRYSFNKSGAFRSHPSVQGIIPQSSTVDVDIAFAQTSGIWFVRDGCRSEYGSRTTYSGLEMFAINFVFRLGGQPMHGMKIGTILMESNLGGKLRVIWDLLRFDERRKRRDAKNLRAI